MTNETFQRGEWVEVSEFSHVWEKKIFFNSLSHNGKIYGYVVYDSEPPSLNFSCWYNIRKIPQPKKTVLKALAITRYSEQHPHHLGQILFRTLNEAKETLGEVFISFPATIRMEDGTDQELWFVCEEE